MAVTTKQQVNALINQIRALARSTGHNCYDLAQLLYGIRESKMYQIVNYESFKDFIDNGELGVNYALASKHATLFGHAKRLDYNKTEACEIFAEFGFNKALVLLRELERKVKISTLRRQDRQLSSAQTFINFGFDSSDQVFVDKVLEEFGMGYSETGQRQGSAEALVAICKEVRSRRRKAA